MASAVIYRILPTDAPFARSSLRSALRNMRSRDCDVNMAARLMLKIGRRHLVFIARLTSRMLPTAVWVPGEPVYGRRSASCVNMCHFFRFLGELRLQPAVCVEFVARERRGITFNPPTWSTAQLCWRALGALGVQFAAESPGLLDYNCTRVLHWYRILE